ncbi:uncharacterized protein LOC127722624 [Mytilus californianus]|uniref:uncharacterized protein LOC127722624 n=1 Tax=Mytilus californianus TaxID=6549 RepID=UPI002245CFB7|nr:uncharacterized protein LOC127722624 [Mytilus californianus]
MNRWCVFSATCIGIIFLGINTTNATNCDKTLFNGYCRDRTISAEGDLNIAIPVSLHESRDGQRCGNISVSGFQSAIAMEWIIKILNGNYSGSSSFIPGLTLGYTIFDDCGLPSRTSSFLTDIFHKDSYSNLQECVASDNISIYTGIVSMTSPDSSAMALEFSRLEVPVISVDYYDEQYDKAPGAFFGVESVETEIKVILEFINSQNWNFIGLVYTEDSVGMKYLDSLIKQSSGMDICYLQLPVNSGNVSSVVNKIITEQNNYAADETFGVLFLGSVKECILFLKEIKSSQYSIASKLMVLLPSSVGTGKQLSEATRPLTNDIFSISPHQILLQNLTKYFQDVIENNTDQHLYPWLSEYKQHICYLLQKSNCGTNDIMAYYRQESQVDKSVVSLISIANALFDMHRYFCNGTTGLCNEMVQNLNHLSTYLHVSNVSLQAVSSFYNIDDSVGFSKNILSLGKSVYNIFNLTKSNESLIGNFSNGVLNLDSNARIQESICKKPRCSRCIDSEELQFGYTPGDVLILGLFSIHQDAYETSNDESKLFKCGSYRTGSTAIITVSAFLESVKSLRDPSRTGLNFGAIALDDCYNELNISALITELFTGQRILLEPKSKVPIDFSKVVAVVGALSSRVTQRIADVMSSLHIPMVSYAASATSLDNRVRYPYFMRTVPSDSLQIEGIIQLISKLNVKYAGALYIDDAYGASGIEGVKALARSNGICIYKPYSIAEDTSTIKMKQILNDNRYIGGVNVIVMFSIDTIIQNILGDSVLSDDNDRNMSSYAPIFVSSEGWGTYLNLANKESAGSLVFTTDSNKQVTGLFNEYLKSLKVLTKTENPWLYRFWEEHFKCYMPRSFEKLSEWTGRCDVNAKLSSDVIQSLVSDQRNTHTEIAVYAIGLAYKSFSGKSVCTAGNCFKRNKENATNWTEAIRSIAIPISDGTNFRPFKPDGNGNLGFTIHNIQRNSSSGFSYVKVGSYDGTLSLQTPNLRFYDHLGQERTLNPISCPTSKCPDACITTTIPPETSTLSAVSNVETSTDIIAIVLGTVAGILFLIVILLTILVFKALRTNNSAMDVKTKELQMDHLSVPIHHRSNRSLNGIYNEPYSQHSSLSDIRRAHHNKGFNSDNESANHPPPSTSSGIVAGSSSDSAGSHIVYSDMTQSAPKSNGDTNYLSPESSDVSNQSLKALTKRVLQPQSDQGIQNQEPNTDSSMTYLSANELLLEDEEESNAHKNDGAYDFGDPEKLGFAPVPPGLDPTDKENIAPPPAYSLSGYNQGTRRPQTLPGISPLQLRPQEISNTGYSSPTPHCNLYTNDMYLKPVADALPTYQQHLEQKQQFQNERAQHVEMKTNLSPNCYNNVRLYRPNSQQNGTAQLPVLSPYPEQVYFTSNNSLSPSSRFGSPGSSLISLSPAQKEDLLNRILHENPSYFHNQCNINYRSPGSSVNSPQSNNAMSPNDKLKQVVGPGSVDTLMNGAIELEDREEVMI